MPLLELLPRQGKKATAIVQPGQIINQRQRAEFPIEQGLSNSAAHRTQQGFAQALDIRRVLGLQSGRNFVQLLKQPVQLVMLGQKDRWQVLMGYRFRDDVEQFFVTYHLVTLDGRSADRGWTRRWSRLIRSGFEKRLFVGVERPAHKAL